MISSYFSYVSVCGILHTYLAYVYSLVFSFDCAKCHSFRLGVPVSRDSNLLLCFCQSCHLFKFSIALILFIFCLARHGGFDSFVFRLSMHRKYG